MGLYTYTKYLGIHIITNMDVEPMTVETHKKENCKDFTKIQETIILPGDNHTFDFKFLDGEYRFIIGEDTVIAKSYLNLRQSIVEGILNYVCDCNCGCNCDGKDHNYCNLLMLRAKVDVYKRLMNPEGVAFYDAINKHTQCLITKSIYCSVEEEIIRGESKCNEKVVKQMILLDYLAMYYYEMAQADGVIPTDHINRKYRTDIIFCCIESLGISLDSIDKLIKDNNMGTFTINTAAYINLPPSTVGDFTLAAPNRVTSILTAAMFTTGTTPAYADPEGDAPKEVRINTLPTTGELKLNGTLVTAGQIIPIADITSGYLGYSAPDQNAVNSVTFTFSVSDTGSGQFTT